MPTVHVHKGIRRGARGQAEAEDRTPPRKGIYWDRAAGQWATRIGYDLDPDTGERVRVRVQRLGADDNVAIVRHAALQSRWDKLGDDWAKTAVVVRHGLPPEIRDTVDLSKPVWPDPFVDDAHQSLDVEIVSEKAEIRKIATRGAATMAGVLEAARDGLRIVAAPEHNVLSLLPPELRAQVLHALQPSAAETRGISATAELLTLAQARTRYAAHLESREGLIGEDGLKAKTINAYTECIDLCLALKVSDPQTGEMVSSLSPETTVDQLSYDILQRHRNNWMRSAANGTHSRKTAANYLRGLRKLLDFCHKSESIAYRHPQDIDELFRFKKLPKSTPPKYEDGLAKLKAILSADITGRGRGKFLKAKEKAKLYTLLGLNLGAYPVDIGGLKLSEIREIDGEHFVVRRRSKTSHQNDFESTHYLWPETYAQLVKHLAPADPTKNPLGLALLDQAGGPLYRQVSGKAGKDLIAKVFRSVRKAARLKDEQGNDVAVDLEFKALRKLGATWMENNCGEQARRMYKAGTLTDGDERYVRDDYAKLTPALKQFADALRVAGVLRADNAEQGGTLPTAKAA